MTDERQGDALWAALARLPRGSGIVFRHHSRASRAARAVRSRSAAMRAARRWLLVLAGPPALAAAWRADGSHGRGRRRPPRSAAQRPGHDAPSCSPPSAPAPIWCSCRRCSPPARIPARRALGPRALRGCWRARHAAPGDRASAAMDASNASAAQLGALGRHGWAAIDAWSRLWKAAVQKLEGGADIDGLAIAPRRPLSGSAGRAAIL